MTDLLQQVGLVPIKTGFLSLVLLWGITEHTEMHGMPPLLPLCSNRGCLERIIKPKRAHNSGCVESTADWQERSSRDLPGSSKKGVQLTFLVASTGVFVSFQRELSLQMRKCFDLFNHVTLPFIIFKLLGKQRA